MEKASWSKMTSARGGGEAKRTGMKSKQSRVSLYKYWCLYNLYGNR